MVGSAAESAADSCSLLSHAVYEVLGWRGDDCRIDDGWGLDAEAVMIPCFRLCENMECSKGPEREGRVLVPP